MQAFVKPAICLLSEENCIYNYSYIICSFYVYLFCILFMLCVFFFDMFVLSEFLLLPCAYKYMMMMMMLLMMMMIIIHGCFLLSF